MSSQNSAFPMTPSLDVPPQDTRTVGLFTEEGARVLDVLRSETARAIVTRLGDESATTSEVADRVDTSLQNATYHLDRLVGAGLLTVVGSHYSARGQEMEVYAQSHDEVVLIGDTDGPSRVVSDHDDDGTGPDTPGSEV